MNNVCPRATLWKLIALSLRLCLHPSETQAGGSGLNVAVVVNQASADSVALGNYYCERRGIPPENLVRINWAGGNTTWTLAEFEAQLFNPLQTALASRQLTNQIRYVVLAMDIPFAVADSGKVNSTTSTLFYGFKASTKSNENSYARSEGAFGDTLPASATGPSYLATMITAGSLTQARQLVDQGVDSDATFPTQTVLLARSSDAARNIRYPLFDNAIFNTRLAGFETVQRIDSDVVSGRSNLLGFQTGLANFSISPNTFVPGAMADSMTSYAGLIFGPNSQTTLLAFIHAGAAGSYGTVTEPGAVVTKFPDPMVYFYQARGFGLAECYYQGVQYPFQGLVVGEPLAAPYRQSAAGAWGVASNEVISGIASLPVDFSSSPDRPLDRVDLFVDGRYFQTLTNLPPRPGNELNLSFAGGSATYTVPANASIASVAVGLATAINAMAASSPANITATAIGDRLEIRSRSGSRPRPPGGLRTSTTPPAPAPAAPLLAGSSIGSAGSLTTFVVAARESSVESTATGTKSCSISGTPQAGSWLRLSVIKTNGSSASVSVTNQSSTASLLEFAAQLADAINATPDLQGSDGLRMDDLKLAASTVVTFRLQPRTPGYAAAGLRFTLTGSTGLTFTPSNDDLRENIADLLPRNHLYVRAGATNLALTFPLDTTRLADGYHTLTAVAYEGSHVRTQTPTSIPVRIQNTPLSATLTLPGFVDPASATGTYPVQVIANQSGVAAIRLFSTGGELGTVANQSQASFNLQGATLGPGLHPIHALVETSAGDSYRTETRWIRLVAAP
jgi:uncharacterized protein (TIGR03790 family)